MTASPQKWYVAVLIVKVVVSDTKEKRPLIDRQFKLIRAINHKAAYQRALKLGQAENLGYRNPNGNRVRWMFVGLEDLDVVGDKRPFDGMEIYSFMKRGTPGRAVRKKEELRVFQYEATKHRPIMETTSPDDLRYAPIAALRWVGRQIERRKKLTAKRDRKA